MTATQLTVCCFVHWLLKALLVRREDQREAYATLLVFMSKRQRGLRITSTGALVGVIGSRSVSSNSLFTSTGFVTIVTWLILPVVICLSQRLSHASLSISIYTAKLQMAH